MSEQADFNRKAPNGVVWARPVRKAGGASLPLNAVLLREAWLDLGFVLVVALLVPLGFQVAAMLLVDETDVGVPPTSIMALSKWFDALLVVVLAGYLVHRAKIPPEAFGLYEDGAAGMLRNVGWGLLTVPVLYFVLVPMVVLVFVLIRLMPEWEADLESRTEFLQMLPLDDMWMTVLLLVPVAIHEELLFRGLLIPYLRRVLGGGWWPALIVSTAIFSVLHISQGWLGVMQIFPVGLVLGLVFVLTRSLTPVIVAHFTYDFLQMQMARWAQPYLEKLGESSGMM